MKNDWRYMRKSQSDNLALTDHCFAKNALFSYSGANVVTPDTALIGRRYIRTGSAAPTQSERLRGDIDLESGAVSQRNSPGPRFDTVGSYFRSVLLEKRSTLKSAEAREGIRHKCECLGGSAYGGGDQFEAQTATNRSRAQKHKACDLN